MSFEMCGARGHAYVMITPQQCLAGLFFLAAALALVGFFGLFFAMAHVRLVIPLAIIAKMLRARVTALPNSRAALCLLFLFNCLLKRVSWRAKSSPKPRVHACSTRHGQGSSPALVRQRTSKENAALFASLLFTACPAQLQLHTAAWRPHTAATATRDGVTGPRRLRRALHQTPLRRRVRLLRGERCDR